MNPRELKEAYKYCESVTKEHAKSFYFANKFLPKDKQKAIYALYALCRNVDDEVDEAEVRSEAEAIRAVEIWQAKLNEVYEGKIQHSTFKIQSSEPEILNSELVFITWEDMLRQHDIPQEIPLDLMKGVLMDTHKNRYETFEELYIYCYRVASTVGLMSSEILGYSDKSALEFAEALGIAMQLTNILRDVKEDAEMNRIYLPQEDLKKFCVSEDQIFANKIDGNFIEMMKFQIQRARHFYKKGEKGIPLLEKDARFCVLLASRIYGQILNEIEKQNFNVFKQRAFTTKSQKLLSVPKIWREARNL
ncbi:MAG: squalene/phytoene synthase family protein [Acidobacteriota bacterium]|jgi:phytoene synthase|nr:squalene/phytoene synthase family protein [Acidobacteriota bacterium]